MIQFTSYLHTRTPLPQRDPVGVKWPDVTQNQSRQHFPNISYLRYFSTDGYFLQMISLYISICWRKKYFPPSRIIEKIINVLQSYKDLLLWETGTENEIQRQTLKMFSYFKSELVWNVWFLWRCTKTDIALHVIMLEQIQNSNLKCIIQNLDQNWAEGNCSFTSFNWELQNWLQVTIYSTSRK